MSKANQFNAAGYFVGVVEDYGLLPNNATYLEPDLKPGFVPKWTGTDWEQVKNHTSKAYDGQPQTPTDYWLPGDTWETPARYMTEFGPLPEGALLEQPEKTQAEIDAERIEQIHVQLMEIDIKSIRALRANETERLAELEAETVALREELERLNNA